MKKILFFAMFALAFCGCQNNKSEGNEASNETSYEESISKPISEEDSIFEVGRHHGASNKYDSETLSHWYRDDDQKTAILLKGYEEGQRQRNQEMTTGNISVYQLEEEKMFCYKSGHMYGHFAEREPDELKEFFWMMLDYQYPDMLSLELYNEFLRGYEDGLKAEKTDLILPPYKPSDRFIPSNVTPDKKSISGLTSVEWYYFVMGRRTGLYENGEEHASDDLLYDYYEIDARDSTELCNRDLLNAFIRGYEEGLRQKKQEITSKILSSSEREEKKEDIYKEGRRWGAVEKDEEKKSEPEDIKHIFWVYVVDYRYREMFDIDLYKEFLRGFEDGLRLGEQE